MLCSLSTKTGSRRLLNYNIPLVPARSQKPTNPDNSNTTIHKNDPENDLRSISIGLDDSFELVKELFADLSRGNGAVVISAARGSGYAEENPSWQNGTFTLCLKAALTGNSLFLN